LHNEFGHYFGEPHIPSMIHQGEFGSCCKDLKESMEMPHNSMFRIEDNDVLYLTIGSINTPEGKGWFDRAVIFCPFCGKQLQTRDDIQRKSNG
jgi:hypothetical protein